MKIKDIPAIKRAKKRLATGESVMPFGYKEAHTTRFSGYTKTGKDTFKVKHSWSKQP